MGNNTNKNYFWHGSSSEIYVGAEVCIIDWNSLYFILNLKQKYNYSAKDTWFIYNFSSKNFWS